MKIAYHKFFLPIMVGLVLVGCILPASKRVEPQATVTKLERLPTNTEDLRSGPVADCLFLPLIYPDLKDLSSECNTQFVHFYPQASRRPIVGDQALRVASFNVFNLGNNQVTMKNTELVAQIINQWDIVAVQELLPLNAFWFDHNKRIYQALQEKNKNLLELAKLRSDLQNPVAKLPGYLELLVELRRLDSSWALILQGEPEGSANGAEMSGFFYRQNKTQIKELPYCAKESVYDERTGRVARPMGCSTFVPENLRPLVSRTAFVAHFEAGGFDFVGLSIHVRFNPDQDSANRKAQEDELCSKERRTNTSACNPNRQEVGRFFEVMMVADQLAELEKYTKSGQAIFMGDFNLELKKVELWRRAMHKAPGYDVYQKEKTTLSVPGNRLASNYDHFIIRYSLEKFCDLKSIRTFDFTRSPEIAKKTQHPIHQLIADELEPKSLHQLLTRYEENIRSWVKFVPPDVGHLSETEIQSFISRNQRALDRMKRNRTGALLELVSDHLPIEMDCRTRARN